MAPVRNTSLPDLMLHSQRIADSEAPADSPMTDVKASPAPRTPDEYYAIWQRWENDANPDIGERRYMAVEAMRNCLERNATDLDLIGFQLRSLPEFLPDRIQSLNVSNNLLTRLPERLPPHLTCLSAGFNRLVALPAELPPQLVRLDVGDNLLAAIPENLPQSLRRLIASANLLTRLPNTLPAHLEYLNISANQLITLSPAIMQLPQEAVVDVAANQLSERTLRQLMAIAGDHGFNGPQILFSMPEVRARRTATPLATTVATWVQNALKHSTAEQWAAIEKEPLAGAFNTFLCRLGETKSAKELPAFKSHVALWLSKVAASPGLRQTTFALAEGATASCEDRVTHSFHEMQKVALVNEVEQGKYDGRLPEMVAAAREMFRLEQLEHIAREKVKKLCFVDEIEVYLAYQTGLRRALQLSCAGKMMRFNALSGVTQTDLIHAETVVKSRERREFLPWLTQWAPWKSALQRLHPARAKKIIHEQQARLAGDYQHRIDAELHAVGLAGIADAEMAIGSRVWREMNLELDMRHTRAVLNERYLMSADSLSPANALALINELVAMAAVHPSVTALAVKSKNDDGEHLGSQLAQLTIKGSIAPLAGAYLCLLRLLYKTEYLVGQEIIALLLPATRNDGVKALGHALAGANWSSQAATLLCNLLAEIARQEPALLPTIRAHLSMTQTGYGFTQLQLAQPADFYKLAKRADNLSHNTAAKAWLKESQLIPQERELYRMATTTAVKVKFQPDFAALQSTLTHRVTPALHAEMQREQVEPDRAKSTAGETLRTLRAGKPESTAHKTSTLARSLNNYALAEKQAAQNSSRRKTVAALHSSFARHLQHDNLAHWKERNPLPSGSRPYRGQNVSAHSTSPGDPASPLRAMDEHWHHQQSGPRWAEAGSLRGELDTGQLMHRLNQLRATSDRAARYQPDALPPAQTMKGTAQRAEHAALPASISDAVAQ